MTLRDHSELCNTRQKLRELEERYQARLREAPDDAHVHDLTLRSLKQLINQLKEEIAVFQTRQGTGSNR